MTGYIPPMPERQQAKLSVLKMWLKGRSCLLAVMPKKSYRMKLGHIRLPFGDIYTACQLELVKQILVDQWERFPKSRKIGDALAPLLGNGLLVSNGEQWKMQRRMMEPVFVLTQLQTVFPLMVSAVDAMTGRLDQLPDGKLLSFDVETAHVTSDTIFRTIFSEPLGPEASRRIFDNFMQFQQEAAKKWAIGVAGIPAFLSPAYFRSRKSGRAIRAELEALIHPRLDDWQCTGTSDHDDILASLLAAHDPETGHEFDFREVVDQVATLFLAGHETTAIGLAWAVYLAAACPNVQERLHAEAVEVFGDRAPEFGDMKKLKFTRDVIRESLRLYPSLPFVARESAHCEKMRDKTIKPGSSILVSPWLIQRHESYWERPNEFDPDRYNTQSGKESLRSAWLPFSRGPRVCAGAGFAMQESMLILASLFRRYRFETNPDDVPIPVGRLTLRSKNGIWLRISRR